MILYHDKPSKELSMNLNANRHQNQSAIDRHRERTNEMLLHNAQFWIEGPGLVEGIKNLLVIHSSALICFVYR